MADKRQLTDRFLRSLPPAKHRDTQRHLGQRRPHLRRLRLRQQGQRPIAARQGRSHRLLHVHPLQAGNGTGTAHHRHLWRITLEDARRTAGEWRSLIGKGIDPAAVEKANREKYNTASWHRRAAHRSRTCHRRGRSMREHGMLKRSQNVPIGGPVLACFDPSGLV